MKQYGYSMLNEVGTCAEIIPSTVLLETIGPFGRAVG